MRYDKLAEKEMEERLYQKIYFKVFKNQIIL